MISVGVLFGVDRESKERRRNRRLSSYGSGERDRMTEGKQDRYTMMTETPVPKLITRLAIPTIISMLVTGFYNMADT